MKSKQSLMVPKKPECPQNEIVKDYELPGPSMSPLFLPVILMLTLVLFALVGCGSTPVADPDFKPTDVTFHIKVPYKCGQPPAVSAVIMRDINWEVIDVKGIIFDEGDEPFTGQLVTLTVDDYKLMGMNISDWLAASSESKEQRHFYRDCIARSQQEIHDENLDSGLVPSVHTSGTE